LILLLRAAGFRFLYAHKAKTTGGQATPERLLTPNPEGLEVRWGNWATWCSGQGRPGGRPQYLYLFAHHEAHTGKKVLMSFPIGQRPHVARCRIVFEGSLECFIQLIEGAGLGRARYS